ncbi:hypothetical protein QMA67_12415 [Gluconobacter japonicus]|nr:hypothetical protein [Gluconobacter japonicus]MDI6653735.1 hypothetical protein [Gluconobacter japonicus]
MSGRTDKDQWIGKHCNGECSEPGCEYCRCYLMRGKNQAMDAEERE